MGDPHPSGARHAREDPRRHGGRRDRAAGLPPHRGRACLRAYQGGTGRIGGLVNELKRLTADNPNQQDPRLGQLIAEKLDIMRATVNLKRGGKSEAAMDLVRTDRGREILERFRGLVAEMAGEENRLLVARDLATGEALRRTTATITIACLLAITFLGASFHLFRRDLRERERNRAAVSPGGIAELEVRVQERTAELAEANQALRTEVAERAGRGGPPGERGAVPLCWSRA